MTTYGPRLRISRTSLFGETVADAAVRTERVTDVDGRVVGHLEYVGICRKRGTEYGWRELGSRCALATQRDAAMRLAGPGGADPKAGETK